MTKQGITPTGLVNFMLAHGFEDAQSQHPDYAVLARPCDEEEGAVVVPLNPFAPHFYEVLHSAALRALAVMTSGYGHEQECAS
jgi:hypothetical protein